MTPTERPFDTIESLSQWLKCSRGTVYNLMADGMPYFALTRSSSHSIPTIIARSADPPRGRS